MGGGGLYGTAGDYIKFTQMILNKGRGNGNQVLKPETVALMGQNHIGELNMTKMTSAVAFATNDVDLYPGMEKKWGLSFLINTAKTPEGRSPGSLAWAGLANTYYWIDPSRDVSRRDPDAGAAVRRPRNAWKPSQASSAASMPGLMRDRRRHKALGRSRRDPNRSRRETA